MIRVFILLFAVALSGCNTSTSALPLSKNVWQIETSGRGLIGMSNVDEATLIKAAELTIQQGYDKFYVRNPQSRSDSQFIGMTPTRSNTSVNFIGNTGYARTRTTGGQPLIARSKTKTITVIMFLADDLQAENGLDARLILASKAKK